MEIALIIVSSVAFALLLIVYYLLGRLDWYKNCYWEKVCRCNELERYVDEYRKGKE